MEDWYRAVRHIKQVMAVVAILHWALPVAAWGWIRLRRARVQGASVLFGKVLLWSWLLLMIGMVTYFFTGAWYSENGNPPDDVFAVDLVLGVYASIYLALFLTAKPSAQAMPKRELAKPFAIFAGSVFMITVALFVIHRPLTVSQRDYAPDGGSRSSPDKYELRQLESGAFQAWRLSEGVLVIDAWVGNQQITLPQDIHTVAMGEYVGERNLDIRVQLASRPTESVTLPPEKNSVHFEALAGDTIMLTQVPKLRRMKQVVVPAGLEPEVESDN